LDISEVIADIQDPAERARKKAEELALRFGEARSLRRRDGLLSASATEMPNSYVYGDEQIQINILSGPSFDNGLLSFTAEAFSSLGDALPVDNPYQFFNPPIMVVVTPAVIAEDPTTHLMVVVTPPVSVEDPVEAMKIMLGEAVLSVAHQNGWSG